jgi:hypothetical protein
MAARGIYFALTDAQRRKLEAAPTDEDKIDVVQLEIETAWDRKFLQETDKAWDAMHRCLSDWPPNTPYFYPVDPEEGGYAMPEDHGAYPLKLCVLGGKRLIEDESRYFIRLIEPREVEDLAKALQPIDKKWLRAKYMRHCEGAWPEYGEDDMEYTWAYFDEVRAFFRRMAGNGRCVIFTADQ